MNANRLLSHFQKISDAPDAVDRLRRFILDLAVRGKLVEQDLGDGIASDLFCFSTTAKVPSRRNLQVLPPPKIAPPFPLPDSWMWVTVGAAFEYDAGIKREPKDLVQDRWLLELEDIEKDTSRLISRLTVKERDPQSTKSEFRVGDILYGKLRPYLNKVVVADQDGYSTTEIVAIRPRADFSLRYCQIAFQRPDFVAYVERLGRGTKMPRLRTPDAVAALFPLPPLPEQYRIVAKVDELMKLCDQLEASQKERENRRDRLVVASLNRLSQPTDPSEFKKDARFQLSNLNRLSTKPEHIKELRKAILNLAVRGKLVPQEAMIASSEGRSYESATELVERLGRHSNCRKAAHQQADKRGGSSLPDLPIGWAWTRMPEIGELNRGRSRHRPRNEKRLYGGPHPFIQTGDVRRSQGTIRHYEQTYSEMGLSQSRMWPKNTLCITIAANIAETGILTFDACFPDSVVGFRYEDPEMPVRYLEYFLRTAKERLNDFAPATAQKNINLDVLANVYVPLPPLAEQKRIVAKVDELMLICDQLETQLEYQQKGRRQLLEALLHEALEGVG